jgi:cytosine/adenosine deaminase-related metal-dependent hydrolase
MPDNFKIKFRALLPMEGEAIENGELLIEQGVVKEIRSTQSPATERCLDLSDHLILPGFVNAHCHLSLSALRGKVPKCEKFTDWVRALLKENLETTWKDRVQALHSGAREMVHSGVTTLADTLSQMELLTEHANLPFRQVVFLEVLGFKSDRVRESLEQVASVFAGQNPKGRLFQLGLAPHSPYSVSPTLFRELKKLATRYDCLSSCHLAEFSEEVRFLNKGGGELEEFLVERGVFDENWLTPGKSPVRYLEDLGVLDSLIAVHLNHIEGDLERLHSSKARAVFCPGSTRWFGRTRYMPVRELLDLGVKVGLGTDSLASNDQLNFLKEIKMADEMLPDVSRPEILNMATLGGAEVLGLPVGAISPGRPADLIGLRVLKKNEHWHDVLFDPGRESVDFSMVAGEVVTEG